jgi:hypothetical protein
VTAPDLGQVEARSISGHRADAGRGRRGGAQPTDLLARSDEVRADKATLTKIVTPSLPGKVTSDQITTGERPRARKVSP